MEKGARRTGKTAWEIAELYTDAFIDDMARLNMEMPSVLCRATDHIQDQIEFIADIEKNGFTYRTSDGIYFNTSLQPGYGFLARLDKAGLEAGKRVGLGEKKSITDFALWKFSAPGEHRQMEWKSPWGAGFPGWHIECSAMAWKHLGEQFDIHGGGIDLVFPHHENELAQSCCAFHETRMANIWMHNGFLQVEGDKMSKSLGNFVTIRELLADWPGEVLRLNMLKTHYRSPIDWTVKGMEESKKTIDNWYAILGDDTQPIGRPDEQVVEALHDDLNTPNAITHLHGLASEIRGAASGLPQIELKRKLKASGMLLGLLSLARKDFLANDPRSVVVDEATVAALLDKRTAARARKDFKESDRIRDELAAMGVVIKDSKDGTTWEIAR
jgi:cysteinyl-tRNA synthetase